MSRDSSKLRRSGMFSRRFMESPFVLRACIRTKLRTRTRMRTRTIGKMVHGEPPFASRMHCDHEPTVSSASPPVEERAGERRPLEFGHPAPRAFSRGWSFFGFGTWNLGFLWSLELGIWSFPSAVH